MDIDFLPVAELGELRPLNLSKREAAFQLAHHGWKGLGPLVAKRARTGKANELMTMLTHFRQLPPSDQEALLERAAWPIALVSFGDDVGYLTPSIRAEYLEASGSKLNRLSTVAPEPTDPLATAELQRRARLLQAVGVLALDLRSLGVEVCDFGPRSVLVRRQSRGTEFGNARPFLIDCERSCQVVGPNGEPTTA